MLVLLIVFLITDQVIKQAVPVKLPNVRYEPTMTKPENVSLTVRNGPGGTCEVYWGVTKVTQKELLDRAVQKLEEADQGGRRRPEHQRRKYARGAHPR